MYGVNHLENSLPTLELIGNSTLAPLSGSALAEIAEPELNRVVTIFEGIGEENVELLNPDELIKLMSEMAEVNNDAYDTREVNINQLSKLVSDIAKKNIYLAQNVVLPMIDNYTNELLTRLQQSTGISNLAIRIVADNTNGLLNSSALINLISQYKDSSGNGYTIGAHQLTNFAKYLKPLLKTGSEQFDEFIDQWYQENHLKLDKVLENTYNAIFVSTTKLELRRLFIEQGYESALFAVLLAKHFLKETPEGVQMELEKYNACLMTVIAAGCAFLGRTIEKYERNIRKGGLILKFPVRGREFLFNESFSGENDILVNPEVYDEYLNQGGSPEAIIGSYLTSNIVDKNTLLAKKDELERAYERIANAGRLNRLNNRLDLIKNTLHHIGSSILVDIDAKIRDNGPYTGIEYKNSNFNKEVAEFIKHTSIHDADDIYGMMRRFVCRIFFKDSHIEELLMKIDLLAKDSPNKDINELAIIASIDFVVEWLVGQLTYEIPENDKYR